MLFNDYLNVNMLILGVVGGSTLKGLYLAVVGKSGGLNCLSSCLLYLSVVLSSGLNTRNTDSSVAENLHIITNVKISCMFHLQILFSIQNLYL